MRDLQTANAFLHGKLDTFAAVARGDIEIWGQIPKVDALALVLERIPVYLPGTVAGDGTAAAQAEKTGGTRADHRNHLH